jgi:hypothetical protein
MSELFIDDGYTQSRTIPAVPGLHPDLTVMYRPALDKERAAYRLKSQSSDPAVIDNHTTDLIVKFIVSVNGEEMKDKPRVAKLKPAIRAYLVDLVLGYLPADEIADAKK